MKKLFFILALLSLSIVAFAQNASVEIVSPGNGEYILDKDVSFKFIYHPGENDLKTANCYLKLQGKRGIGPLEVPVETEGQIDITDMPRGNFIWYMDCNGYYSSPYLLVMGNQSYEEFKQSLIDAAKNNTSNVSETTINNQTNTSVVQNQSEISPVQNQSNSSTIQNQSEISPIQNQTNASQTLPVQNTSVQPAQNTTVNIPSYTNLTTTQPAQINNPKTPASGTFDIAYFAVGALVVVIIGAAIYYVYKRKEKKEGAK